ncbi:phosphatase PAP2 family protein [Neobacillus notoginsengisoli]|uniref:Phosphatase PAP2 family protein n=1 Tax=Neobacillus notoginsengisoli TaxID=1578198 RepID=A0A417YXI2_9BACI|nr:phosphatase PAP2 family protein [Neobacillus notoginsengisoli]RHW42115.1 phosphatase PAP2 family protein [Neobacillus notoginsengisoli]
MNTYIKKSPYLLFLLVMPLLGMVYKFLNTHPREAVHISTAADGMIPFLPIFIIPYIFWYGYVFFYLVYFCFKDTKVYLKTLILIVVGEIICFLVYFFFQTIVPRPQLHGDGFLIEMVKFIYANDEPYNCFPSIHVLTTFAIMLGSRHIYDKHPINTMFIHIAGSLIIISTLFVKQHVVPDMIASMFLVSFLYGILFELYEVAVSKKADTVFAKNK